MGLSFANHVLLVCKKDEREWFNALPERKSGEKELPASHSNTECPVSLVNHAEEGKVLYVSTKGYGVIDWTDNLPGSCYGVVSYVKDCLKEDVNYVECVKADALEYQDWEPFNKEVFNFEFEKNLPEQRDDEDSETYDQRYREAKESLVNKMKECWLACQIDLGVKEPLPID